LPKTAASLWKFLERDFSSGVSSWCTPYAVESFDLPYFSVVYGRDGCKDPDRSFTFLRPDKTTVYGSFASCTQSLVGPYSFYDLPWLYRGRRHMEIGRLDDWPSLGNLPRWVCESYDPNNETRPNSFMVLHFLIHSSSLSKTCMSPITPPPPTINAPTPLNRRRVKS